MNVRHMNRSAERRGPSPKALALCVAGALAFGATMVVPIIGTPLIAATAVVALVSSKKE